MISPFVAMLVAAALGLQEEGRVWPRPDFAAADAWTSPALPGKAFAFFSREEALFVRIDCARDNRADLRLKSPVAVPDEATGFTFRCGNNGIPSGVRIMAILKDAGGREFLYYTVSWFSYAKGVFLPEQIQRRGTEERFVVPGLKRVDLEPSGNATIEGPEPGLAPRRPLSLVGLRFVGEQQGGGTASTEFYFRDFAFTRLSPATSPLYYQFRDQECHGELDPLPFLTPAHMGKWYGRRFEMSWEIRDAYEGNPFHADGATFAFDPAAWEEKNDRPSHPLQLARQIRFPVKERGTYWARVRLRWSLDGRDPLPQEIVEKEFRLDVIRGEAPPARPPVAPDAAIPNCLVRVAPDRNRLVWGADEKFLVRVLFRRPAPELKDLAVRIVVRAAGGDEEVKTLEATPVWDGGATFWAETDLSTLPPGSYEVHAQLRSEGRVVDEARRPVGRRSTPPPGGTAEIPAAAPSGKDLLARPRPMFHLSPLLPDGTRQDGKQAWDEYYRPFLERAGEISRDIELLFDWKTVEPLPGVFDWRFVDRFVDDAQSKGLTVLLWPSFRDLPEWVPGLYEQNVDGQVFGSRQPYLFHGGRPNYVHAGAIRDRLIAFIEQVARRYRAHPAVSGYFFCFEHPGDAPYAGWTEGYAAESVQAFRAHGRETWKTVEAVNGRWGTRFVSWAELVPPTKEASPQYWLDWLRFKADGIEGLLKALVRATRAADPKRLIVVYADGIDDLRWFQGQGCMTANGGSHDAMAIQEYAAFPLAGLPQRTEDHSPGDWTGYFPSQLDASLFAMMAGGGANAHAKAFVLAKNRFSDANDPLVSLGRYKRFLPIWTELRATETAEPVRVFVLKDLAAYMVGARTTYKGWSEDPWLTLSLAQGQVSCASGAGDLWERGRLLVIGTAQGRHELLEGSLIDRIVRYVEDGGAVVMSASAGRRRIEAPGAEDWVLLRRLGFDPPAGELVPDRKATASPRGTSILKSGAGAFTLRETWEAGPQKGSEAAACFGDDAGRPALSWRAVGKGKAAVVWAQTLVPPLFSSEGEGYAFLGDVARWAGAAPAAEVTDTRFWTNLLKTRDGGTFYGLAHVGWWAGAPAAPVQGSIRWGGLPAGTYRVTELLSGRPVGDFTAEQLKRDGLPLKLAPRETAVFRMVPR